MNRKITSLISCALLIVVTLVPHIGAFDTKTISAGNRGGWTLQWTHAYGGNGEAEFAQPIGDVDSDGIIETIMGGYDVNPEARIMHYDTAQQTYVVEYSWDQAGGVPSGACIADLNLDGSPLLCVSWAYSSADGVYAYKYDGTTLTQLDYYYGTGVDFVFDIYVCDYNDDGALEVLIANAPNMGPGTYHVTALGWNIDTQKFYYETSWACPGGSNMECPMVWSGDVDNDGLTEIIADVSNGQSETAGTWALNWNPDTQAWDGVAVYQNYGSSTVYGDGVGDIDGDGTLEIGVGCYGGSIPQGWLFEWDGSAYQLVWNGQYPGQWPTIEAVALGDADNDGQNEFCFGTGYVHIIAWNGTSYYEKATLTDPTGMLAGMNIGDCDTDGKNELKGCEILSGTGSQFIWKYVEPDTVPPVTTCELDGEMNGNIYVSNVTVTLSATDNGTGVDYTKYKLDTGVWTIYTVPFVVTADGGHTLSFYSVDHAGNTEATQNVTFVIMHHPSVTLNVKGGVGVSLEIVNNGSLTYTMLPWSITLDGKHILKGESLSGTILSLDPGKTRTFTDKVLGFGKTGILVDVGGVQKSYTAFVFLVFVLGVK